MLNGAAALYLLRNDRFFAFIRNLYALIYAECRAHRLQSSPFTRDPLAAIAIALWSIALLVICVRLIVKPDHNIFGTYMRAGAAWVQGGHIYSVDQGRGFVYSPLIAAFFAPFSTLPVAIANMLWRLLNAGVFVGAVWRWLEAGIQPTLPRARWSLVFLLLLPLSLGNFSNGQANPLVIGLLMFGVLGARSGRWFLAALCVALAAYFKIYPLAVGLLICLIHPRQFPLRLLLALALLAALTFLCQHPAYVLVQYRSWIATRSVDNRLLYDNAIAPHDLWLVIRTLRLPVSAGAYQAIQLLGAAAVAGLCFRGRLMRWSEDRLLLTLFCLACCWMILLGPATESPTYILICPAVVLSWVGSLQEPSMEVWLRRTLLASLTLFLLGFLINSLIRQKDWFAFVQPVGALAFTLFATAWLLNGKYWSARPVEA